MASRHAVFRCDAAPEMGGGHAVRCMALAGALGDAGWRATFAGIRKTVETVPAIAQSGYGWWELSGPPESEPSALRSRAPGGCDALIVDHYGRDSDFESSCRGWAARIIAIEDIPGRAHDCDLLLDPTPGRAANDYAGLVPAGCQLLLGPNFALLRRQFAVAREAALGRRKESRDLSRLFVSFGATDPTNLTSVVLEGIAASGLACIVDVVVGSAAKHIESVRALANAMDGRVRLHVDVPGMAELMAAADLAVGAAGTTSYERCCLGLPSLIVIAADNQKQIAAALVNAGAAVSLGEGQALRPAHVARALQELARDPLRRARLSQNAWAVCDGRGASRAAISLAPEWATDGKDVGLRPATRSDGAVMLVWQRDPVTRRFARNSAVPTEPEHWAWLERKLADPRCLFNMVTHDGQPSGVLRLDRVGNSKAPVFEVSILVAPEKQKLGLGKAALRLASRLAPEAELLAEVHPDNAASHSLFASAGFRRDGLSYRHDPLAREARQ